MQMLNPSSLKEGQQATFYITGWLYGENLAVKEIATVTGQIDSQSNLRPRIAAKNADAIEVRGWTFIYMNTVLRHCRQELGQWQVLAKFDSQPFGCTAEK